MGSVGSQRRLPGLLLAAMSLVSGCASMGDGENAKDPTRQILLTVTQTDHGRPSLSGAPGRRYLRRSPYGRSTATERLLDRIAEDYALIRADGWPIRSLGVYCEVFMVPGDISVDDIVAQLVSDPRVDSAQRMQTFQVMSRQYDDPYYDLQSGAHRLRISGAHEWADGTGVTIAVVDTGVDTTHPELAGRIKAQRSFLRHHEQAHTLSHGTAVAGVIASAANNRIGIVGIAPGAKILVLEACWRMDTPPSTAHCSSFTLAQALETAIEREVDVINLSLAGPSDALLGRLLAIAIDRGITVVGAALPDSRRRDYFPALVDGVITVHSAERMAPPHGERGYLNALAAPGSEILTLLPRSGYDFRSGSSMAAAQVSGVAALLLERDPGLTPARVADLIDDGAHGESVRMVDACGALSALEGRDACDLRLSRRPLLP